MTRPGTDSGFKITCGDLHVSSVHLWGRRAKTGIDFQLSKHTDPVIFPNEAAAQMVLDVVLGSKFPNKKQAQLVPA